jgi:murein L,D-transpeptidase YcbB/YkuD
MGPATYLGISAHGRDSAVIDARIAELYHANDLQPFWIEDGKPGQRAVAIRAALADAGSHGLDPASYFVDKIDKIWDSKDITGLVRLDILLTLGMLRYAADQREGRMEPREVDPKLFAAARDVEVDWEALKQAAFTSPDMNTFLAQQAPSYGQYAALQAKLAEYQALAAQGGWPAVPTGPTLKPGQEDPRVRIVRQRLAVTGEIPRQNLESAVFDDPLAEAVKRFQKRHYLHEDGIIGEQTLAAMNVPVTARIRQIIINMERYRWLKRVREDDRFVVVNIAGFDAAAGRPGHIEVEMPVIVGKLYHKTPVFSDEIQYVVINPYWNLTPSIARNETLPKLKQDPHYLEKHNMRIFDGWGPDAKELDATTMDWRQISKKEMNRYRVRQDPGPNNALGILKLVFPNEYNVYLHDTPAHGLFKEQRRAFSHGCIRMDRPAEMAAWVLGGEAKGWNVARVNEIVASKERQVFVPDQPVPVYILYRTAYVNLVDNTLYFYEDIYGRDLLLAQALWGEES